MDCTRCGKTNRGDRSFCIECGSSLTARCPRCSDELDPGARFCGACGFDVSAASDMPGNTRETRKVVTIIFADLVGSTALHEQLDAESVRRIMERYYDALRSVVATHDGTLVKLMGDGVMIAFGVPHVLEDDAMRAVRCAVAIQESFANLVAELGPALIGIGLRVAVNSGEVVVRDDDADVLGDPVNVAARLQQEAGVGEVVIGESTRRLVGSMVTLEPIGERALKGRVEAVPAYRVVSMERPLSARSTSFVGREDEFSRLLARYHSAVDLKRPELAVVLGSPGLGKSRLLAEVAAHVAEEACVLSVSCTSGGATFAPLGEGLRVVAGVDDQASEDVVRGAIDALVETDAPDRERVIEGVSALLAGAPPPPEETFYVVRRLVGLLGVVRPVVLVFDDVHWAQPLLFDLIEHLAEWSRDTALLVLVAGRPELREMRSSLAMPGRLLREVVVLEGLDASAAARLAADVVGADELPAVVAGPVLTASDGNPLFLGELVRMLVDDGTLRREHDRWTTTVDLTKLELPPTILALLASRIERLGNEERTVLERAAVIGPQFSRAALAELVPVEAHVHLDAHLEALGRAELIDPDGAWFLGEPMLRFHHVLIREAAYQRMLKESRAELHVRFADWVARQIDDAAEYDELLGLHLEAARDCRADLGASDADIRVLGDRAAAHLAAAGQRALGRDDVAAAASLLGRAVRCLGADDEARAELALDWCEALLSAGAVDEAGAAIAELARWVNTSPRLSAWLTCFRGQLAVLTDPVALRDTAAAVADAATQLTAVGDDAGEAKAYSVHAQALAGLGEIGACETALDRALVAARRARDWRRANAVLAGAPSAQLWGPSPLTRASGRCLDVVRVLRITSGSPAVEAVALRSQAVLETLRGRADAARHMLSSSRATVEELGLMQRVLEADQYAGIVELYDGDPAAAEPWLRAAYEGSRVRGLADAGLAAALVGRAVLAQGRAEEAEALSYESEALAGQGLKAAIAWRALRAEALAARGAYDDALHLATAAVSLAASTDLLLDHADARLAMASVLRAAGRYDEANAEVARAIELWETKGATALIERTSSTALRQAPPPIDARNSQRPVPVNDATRAQLKIDAAFAARDVAALRRLTPDDAVFVSHPTGREYTTQAAVTFLQSMLDAGDGDLSYQPLAALGQRLALFRIEWTIGAMAERHLSEWGISSGGGFTITEVDGRGLEQRYEQFGDQLQDAIVRLYELYAEELPEGLLKQQAAAIAAALGDNSLRNDSANWAATLSPDVELVDRRRLGLGSFRGRDVHELGIRLFADLASSISFTVEDVLALDPTAQLLRFSIKGVDRATGGAFETTYLNLMQHAADGGVRRIEMFDVEDVEAALARFDQLANGTPATASWVVETTATRVQDRMYRAMTERDWNAYRVLCAPEMVWHDQRPGAHLDGDIDTIITSGKIAFEQLNARVERRATATRGDRHALEHSRFMFTDDLTAESISEVFNLIEVDLSGRVHRYAVFESSDVDSAVRQLDAWYLATEPNARTWFALASAVNERDWDAAAQLLTTNAAIDDRRPVSLISVQGQDEMLASWQQLCASMPDIRLSTIHIDVNGPHALIVHHWDATRDGAQFELDRVAIETLDEDGRVLRFEAYDVDQLDVARTRFEQLASSESPPAMFANAASRACDERGDCELLATRDEHLALCRRGDRLELCQVDNHGQITALSTFDGDDIDRAYEELDNTAGTSDEPLALALSTRDWTALRALTAPDVVMEDHRSVALFTVHGREALINIWQGAFEALPDARIRADHVRTSATGSLVVARWIGTRDGLEFDAPRAAVYQRDTEGRVSRIDTYDLDQIDDARARFNELAVDPADVVPQNAIANLHGECVAAENARDWDRVRAYHSPDFRFIDHTRVAHIESDLEQYIEMLRYVATDPNFTVTKTQHIATVGERVLVAHTRARGGAEASWESEQLSVAEMDTAGRICAMVIFEVTDRRAAFAEARTRFLAGEGAATRDMHEAVGAVEDMFRARDWAGMRALHHPDFSVIRDHRRLRILPAEQTFDEQAASLLEFTQLAPDIETLRIVEWNERGALMLQRTWGTTNDGSQFENLLLDLVIIDTATHRVLTQELYDADDLDRAVARFRELTTGGRHAVPANMASRALDDLLEAFGSGDWDAARALFAPEYRHIDHTRAAHIDGDSELYIASLQYGARDPNFVIERQRMATFGERVFVSQSTARGGSATSSWEFASVAVTEVDADGLLRATVVFETSERCAAFADARARFLAGEGAATRRVHETIRTHEELFRARDWQGMRAVQHPSFSVARDHRKLHITPEQQTGVEQALSLVAFAELAPDVDTEPLRIVAWNDRGAVMHYRTWGTTDAGSEFENQLLEVLIVDSDTQLVAMVELYDTDDVESAVTRFEELTLPRPEIVPPSAAARLWLECIAAHDDRDWDRARAFYATDFRFIDHTRAAHFETDLERYIEMVRYVGTDPHFKALVSPIATFGNRVFITHTRARGGSASIWDFEQHTVIEADTNGLVCTVAMFEVTDRRAAFEEARARFIAGEGSSTRVVHEKIYEFEELFRAHDLTGLRAVLRPEYSTRDHRGLRILPPEQTGEEWLAAQRGFLQLAPDVDTEPLRIAAWTDCGAVMLYRTFGTTADGTQFENLLLDVIIVDLPTGQMLASELFDVNDVDAATARLHEFAAEPEQPRE